MPEHTSPGGFVFGVQGFSYADPIPTCITWYIDGTAAVIDQYGRPIDAWTTHVVVSASKTAVARLSHQEVVKKLADAGVNWQALTSAGWPQLPYAELKKLRELPPTPEDELRKIKDKPLRLDALKMRREADKAVREQMQAAEAE
jgi:hypothetical protein